MESSTVIIIAGLVLIVAASLLWMKLLSLIDNNEHKQGHGSKPL